VNSTTVSSGGEQYVVSGGTATGTTISSGGLDVVFGVANGATVSSGGQDYILSGGAASGTKVNGGPTRRSCLDPARRRSERSRWPCATLTRKVC
jgi:autotransporter passenger strand-loop-strand repeat protein